MPSQWKYGTKGCVSSYRLQSAKNDPRNNVNGDGKRSSKMYGKVIFSIGFLLLLVFSYSIFIGTVDFRSYFFPRHPLSPAGPRSACATGPPLKVYMYELPRRFHVGMMDHKSKIDDGAPVTAENLPLWPKNSGIKKQHSVEYWLMASLLYEGGGEEREVVRVLNPERADAFFVPFFSSLSFNTHGHNMTDPETEKDRQLQVDVIEFLSQSKHWQRSGGRDHVIPMTHPNAFRFLRQQLNASILIVADFGRYPKSMSTLWKDVVAPYVHVVDFFTDDEISDPFESRTTLLFFRGGMVRKDEGKVRAELAKILAGYDDVHFEQSTPTPRTIKMSTQGMRSSKFCLHPAGDTPSSCRLFDAIAIQPGYIVDQLRQFSKERWVKMWRQLKNISHHFEFQYPPKKEDAVDMLWRQVKHKLPSVQLSVHRSGRLKVPDWWQRTR
ncbi:probable arabinosyltransferase ARAD1 isoform X2 [Hevea brasiliensis]|uniref:probable arabinosyltransferase ARAD1 isoform X2 n=1 Tax=Hevea brasiliensis TaxID=3981 RepID=UPI0025DA1C62|nr:probable arabinosyltransferase ARAD1 isoform X2 [Hevea brasiliensis]